MMMEVFHQDTKKVPEWDEKTPESIVNLSFQVKEK